MISSRTVALSSAARCPKWEALNSGRINVDMGSSAIETIDQLTDQRLSAIKFKIHLKPDNDMVE